MLEKIYKIYAYLFAKKIFNKLNKFLFNLSLRGLGILNYQNEYLTGEKKWLNNYLKNKKNPVVLDVGANIGNYSLNVFEVNKSSKLLAFEPHYKTYKKLISNCKKNNFKAYNVAVGSEDNIVKLFDYDSNDGSQHASLYEDVITDLHKSKSVSHEVNMIKLDIFLKDVNLDVIDLLKIDTEGNELEVLLGAKEYIEKNKIKAIHFEFNEMNIISKVRFKDFWDLLSNYNIYRILPGGELLEIKNYSPVTCEIYAFQNIVAILK